MASIVDKCKLSEKQDRRVKLTSDKKEEIRKLYGTGRYSLNDLAKMYSVSKKLILLTVNDKSMKKNKEYVKTHWKDYKGTTEEHTEAIRNTRKYKKELYKKGELK